MNDPKLALQFSFNAQSAECDTSCAGTITYDSMQEILAIIKADENYGTY